MNFNIKEQIEYLLSNYESMPNLDEEVEKIIETADINNLDLLYKPLPDIFVFMKDPRILLPTVIFHFENYNSFYISQSLFFLMKEYLVEYEHFYRKFYDLILKENIDKEFLAFIKLILNEDKLTLSIIMAYIKKLCREAVNIESQKCLEILNLILVLMKLYPVTFQMVSEKGYKGIEKMTFDEYEPYLFELDILSNGIYPIRKVVTKIRNEALKKNEKYDRLSLLEEDCGKRIEDYIK